MKLVVNWHRIFSVIILVQFECRDSNSHQEGADFTNKVCSVGYYSDGIVFSDWSTNCHVCMCVHNVLIRLRGQGNVERDEVKLIIEPFLDLLSSK